MYAENGAAMRQELAALLRQHRVQQRLGGTLNERADLGVQMRQYRQTVLRLVPPGAAVDRAADVLQPGTRAAEPVPGRRLARATVRRPPPNSPARSTSRSPSRPPRPGQPRAVDHAG